VYVSLCNSVTDCYSFDWFVGQDATDGAKGFLLVKLQLNNV
jgi:hypothetical protein